MSHNKPDVTALLGESQTVTKHSHAFLIIFPPPRKTIKSGSNKLKLENWLKLKFRTKTVSCLIVISNSLLICRGIYKSSLIVWNIYLPSDGFPLNVFLIVIWARFDGIEAPSEEDNHDVEAAETKDASPEARHTPGYGLEWWHNDIRTKKCPENTKDTKYPAAMFWQYSP